MKLAFRMFAGALLAVLVTLAAALAVEGVKTQSVQYSAGNNMTATGFLATPEKSGRYPGVIVIHEWWGLNDWIKDQTEKLAAQGYVALAVDLFRGAVATDTDDAHELSRALPDDRVIANLTGAFDYLGKRDDVDHDHIGAIGWCMGGGYALQLAMHQPRLAAVVVNYGALPTDPNDVGLIYAPFLGNFGADDRGITPADVNTFEAAMKNLNRRVDIKIYPGAGHAFANPNDPKAYRPDAAADAWNRDVTFLSKWLK